MPMSSPSVTVLGFLLLSVPALAGDVYTFSIGKGDVFRSFRRRHAKVLLDGRKYRLELKPDPESTNPYQV